MRIQFRVGWLTSLLLIMPLTACKKKLDENYGKSLLEAQIKDGPRTPATWGPVEAIYKGNLIENVPAVPFISQWLNITTPAQLSGNNFPGNALQASRLLSIGFLAQESQTVSYPIPDNPTVIYSQQSRTVPDYCGGNPPAQINFSVQPQDAAIAGTYLIGDPIYIHCDGPVTGTANTDGTIDISLGGEDRCIHFGHLFQYKWHFTSASQNQDTTLVGNEREYPNRGDIYNHTGDQCYYPWVITLKGHTRANVPKITWSRYSVSPNAQKWASPTGEYIIGTLNVTGVSSLTLVGSDVQAHASFDWTATFNELGKAMSSLPTANGTGSVNFSKKPDGDWTVSNYSLTQ